MGYFLEYEERNLQNRGMRRKCNKYSQRKTGKTDYQGQKGKSINYQEAFQENNMISGI